MSASKESIASSKSPRRRPRAASSEFPYAALGHGETLHPAIEVKLLTKAGAEFPFRMLPDSGADHSCFPKEFAQVLGVDLDRCERTPVHTGNGLADHYCHVEPLSAVIAEREVSLTASFGPIRVPILGREDFFSEFLVEVDEPRRVVVITPHD